jgi:short-subunit dehydrogenase
VLVTGASRGLGLAVAKILLRRGDFVILNGRDTKRLTSAQNSLPGRSVIFAADVAESGYAQKLSKLLQKNHIAHLDCVIHNAGINHMGSIVETKPANAEQTFHINACSVINLIKSTEPFLAKANSPRFVLVSSLMKYFPMPGRSVYAASKAAAEQFAQAWQLELKAQGSRIRVQIFRPAGIETDFHHNTPTDGSAPRSDISRMSAEKVAVYLADFTLSARAELAPGAMNKLVAFVARHFPGVTRLMLFRRYKKNRSNGDV